MGIYNKNRGTNVSGVFEFPNGATLTSTSTSTTLITVSSALTVTDTLTVTGDGIFSSAATFSGTTKLSSGVVFKLPNVSTGTAPSTTGLFGYSTASGKLVFGLSTSDWLILSTA